VALPRTAAGTCAAAFFDAFNWGSDATLRAFLEQYHSPAYLERHPVQDRMAYYRRIRDMHGALTPVGVALSLDLQLTLLVHPARGRNAVIMRFQLDDAAPHPLAYVTASAVDHFKVPNDYIAYVATRAAPLDSTLRARTVRSVAESLRAIYVYPQLGQRMADSLMRNEAEGRYDDLRTVGKLATRLTEDAVAVSKDLHVWVEAQNPMAQASSDPGNRDVVELRRDNYDFRGAKVLAGNVGYLKFDMIHDEEEAQAIMSRALAHVARCDALVFDLRENIGGEWGTADLILGYLLPPGTALSRHYDRDGRLIEERVVRQAIPGKPFDAGVPVYVLTSRRTGSAAEALAYTLKSLGRATVVGEVTSGAAHPAEEVVVNEYFRVSIPFRRSENVITRTDWEGVGVMPTIEVAANRALSVALENARERIGGRK
jgi:hypothetical protein